MRATCPAHLTLLDLITRTVLGEEYRSFSSSLCSFLHSPVTLFLLGPNILLSTLFSNTHSLCSSLNVSDQVSHPYNTVLSAEVILNLTDTELYFSAHTQHKRKHHNAACQLPAPRTVQCSLSHKTTAEIWGSFCSCLDYELVGLRYRTINGRFGWIRCFALVITQQDNSPILKINAMYSSETSTSIYRTPQRHNAEGRDLDKPHSWKRLKVDYMHSARVREVAALPWRTCTLGRSTISNRVTVRQHHATEEVWAWAYIMHTGFVIHSLSLEVIRRY